MATIDVGRKPEYLRCRLIPNSDFELEFTALDDDLFDVAPAFHFPIGADTALVWTATVSLDRKVATWQIPSAEVDELIAASLDRKARLILGPLVWAEGKFEVSRD